MFLYEQAVVLLHELVLGAAFEAADDMETCQATAGCILSISKVRKKKNKKQPPETEFSYVCFHACAHGCVN